MNITQGLRRALQINPDGLAIVCGERRQNWRRNRRTRGAPGRRHPLARRQDGDRVAILSLNSDRYLELYLAAGWSGTVIVPLNIRWSPLENEDAMRDCRAEHPVRRQGICTVGSALAKAIPGLKLVYADDGETPAGMESYETLIARNAPMPDAMRDERRPRRHLLHRRHHRPLQGRHAQPRQSDGQCAECARARACVRAPRPICTPRRCSISPTARRCIRCC